MTEKEETVVLPKISKEQEWIVKRLEQGYNVVVDSVAGSGKTTTNLYIAKRFEKSKILLLTYNSKLRLETRVKAQSLGLDNIEVHTYHSFCVKYYTRTAFTDTNIIRYLNENKETEPLSCFSYDFVILDEAQDMTPIYYEVVLKLLKFNKAKKFPLICVLGDRQQSIYAFNKADERYIINASTIFGFSPYPWKRRDLSYSFRMTKPMIDFLNKAVLNTDRLKSEKKGCFPTYIFTNAFSEDESFPQYSELFKLLEEGQYKPEDIFVLAPSIRKPIFPVRRFANLISKKGIDIYVPVSDEERIDETIIKKKMLFSTFHQAKGMERKVVFVFGFDSSYFKYFGRDKDQFKCPNEIYVASTRAKEKLFLIHDRSCGCLPFINPENIMKYCKVLSVWRNPIQNLGEEVSRTDITREISVSDLIRHIPASIILQCLEHLEIKQVRKSAKKIRIPTKIKQKVEVKVRDRKKMVETFEGVAEINGTAIPAYFDYMNTGSSAISDMDLDDIPTLLKEANTFCAKSSGYMYKLRQIKSYDWVDKFNLDRCVKRLRKLHGGILEKGAFEKKFKAIEHPELFGNSLFGFVDCVAGNSLYEFKCTSSLEETHIIQLALYAYLSLNENASSISKSTEKLKHFYLFNILTKETLEIKFTRAKLAKLVELLIITKQGLSLQNTKAIFLKTAKTIRKQYFTD